MNIAIERYGFEFRWPIMIYKTNYKPGKMIIDLTLPFFTYGICIWWDLQANPDILDEEEFSGPIEY